MVNSLLDFLNKNFLISLNDSTERLVKIRRLLEQAKTDKEEQLKFNLDNNPFILNIPTGTFLSLFI